MGFGIGDSLIFIFVDENNENKKDTILEKTPTRSNLVAGEIADRNKLTNLTRVKCKVHELHIDS